uniref:Reverse transcriptase domain-containing protein n=1 Tax=Tanacetum cinerariifolium TaxID=118510 RepID=A0A6L2MKP0_TANCI|nr:reverse transcriptase domain-containing protein [Tanacetum cinerariifolium]
MEGKGSSGSKQTPTKNQDAHVTKGELEEARKAAEEAEKKRKIKRLRGREKQWKIRELVKYASHLLKGEARHWWNMSKIARGNDVASVMTWEEFEDLVMENYYP